MKKNKLLVNKNIIKKFIAEITKNWVNDTSSTEHFEVRCIHEYQPPIIQSFLPKELDIAADLIVKKNNEYFNIYMTINPIASIHKINKVAKDENIAIAHFSFADADDKIGLEGLQHLSSINPPDIVVTTGTIPRKRLHYYWRLNISCKDMNKWRSYQKRIAESLGTDKSVINPCRIMRVPGSITHPNKKKQLKGYITEMVSMNIRQYNGA